MRLKLISCEIFEREINAATARSINQIHVEFLDKTQHQTHSPDLVPRLQERIDRIDRAQYHAVLLVSGSCKLNLTGLQARSIPLVLPRARDCISLVMSQDDPGIKLNCKKAAGHLSLKALADRTAWLRDSGVWAHKPKEPRKRASAKRSPSLLAGASVFRGRLRASGLISAGGRHRALSPGGVTQAAVLEQDNGWKPRRPMSILQELVDGYWSYAHFLVVPPGWQVVAKPDEGTIQAEELIP